MCRREGGSITLYYLYKAQNEMDQNNLDLAARYLNQLVGKPRTLVTVRRPPNNINSYSAILHHYSYIAILPPVLSRHFGPHRCHDSSRTDNLLLYQEWLADARALLELRQSAAVLMNYAKMKNDTL